MAMTHERKEGWNPAGHVVVCLYRRVEIVKVDAASHPHPKVLWPLCYDAIDSKQIGSLHPAAHTHPYTHGATTYDYLSLSRSLSR